MGKTNKGTHIGSGRRAQLLNIVKNLGFEGIPNPHSNAVLAQFVLTKKPEIKARRINARLDVLEILMWFETNDRDALKSPKSRNRAKHRSRRGGPSADSKAAFYRSWDWRTARMHALKQHGTVCQCCGAQSGQLSMSGEPVRICVDHVKPLATHWHLRLDPGNLQVLCDECNQGKGAWDNTDYRPSTASSPDRTT